MELTFAHVFETYMWSGYGNQGSYMQLWLKQSSRIEERGTIIRDQEDRGIRYQRERE
jgi:hypothetical protein